MRNVALLVTVACMLLLAFGQHSGNIDGSSLAKATALDLRSRGVGCDGNTDYTSAVQAAVSAAKTVSSPLTILVPPCIVRLASTVTVSAPVKFKGAGHSGQGFSTSPSSSVGSAFKLDHTGYGFTIINSGFGISDITIFRPQANDPTVPGWTPLESDFDFNLAITDAVFERVSFWGTNKGIQIVGGGRLTLRDIVGQFFTTGLKITSTSDKSYISNFDIFPIWSEANPVRDYSLTRLTGFDLQRVDGLLCNNIFMMWTQTAIAFNQGVGGVTTNFKCANVYLDGVGSGVVTAVGTNGISADFTNMTHNSDVASSEGYGVRLRGDASRIAITNFRSIRAGRGTVLNTEGNGNVLSFSGLFTAADWNADNAGAVMSNVSKRNITVLPPAAVIGGSVAGSTAAIVGPHQGLRLSGTFSLTTDASGYIAIPHGLGRALSSARVFTTGAHPYNAHVVSIDSTNINVIIYNGRTELNATPVTGTWDVFY